MNSLAVILGTVVGKLLDPLSFVVALIVTAFSREKWIIVVAALCAALITETVITSMQVSRSWGQGIMPGIIASLLHAVFSFWLVGRFRKPKVNISNNEDDKNDN